MTSRNEWGNEITFPIVLRDSRQMESLLLNFCSRIKIQKSQNRSKCLFYNVNRQQLWLELTRRNRNYNRRHHIVIVMIVPIYWSIYKDITSSVTRTESDWMGLSVWGSAFILIEVVDDEVEALGSGHLCSLSFLTPSALCSSNVAPQRLQVDIISMVIKVDRWHDEVLGQADTTKFSSKRLILLK